MVQGIILLQGWIGGDQPSDIFNAAKARKEAGYTAVKVDGIFYYYHVKASLLFSR